MSVIVIVTVIVTTTSLFINPPSLDCSHYSLDYNDYFSDFSGYFLLTAYFTSLLNAHPSAQMASFDQFLWFMTQKMCFCVIYVVLGCEQKCFHYFSKKCEILYSRYAKI